VEVVTSDTRWEVFSKKGEFEWAMPKVMTNKSDFQSMLEKTKHRIEVIEVVMSTRTREHRGFMCCPKEDEFTVKKFFKDSKSDFDMEWNRLLLQLAEWKDKPFVEVAADLKCMLAAGRLDNPTRTTLFRREQ
jgi:hypothetical protein